MNSTSKSICIVLALLFAVSLFGCPNGDSDQPVITLTVTDCATGDITMTLSGTEAAAAGNQWRITATIEVKCSGAPVPNAELKAEFWWPGGTLKLVTGQDGKATHSRMLHADPSGSTYTVTIKGNNGEKVESYRFP